jgi:hypothetical protein
MRRTADEEMCGAGRVVEQAGELRRRQQSSSMRADARVICDETTEAVHGSLT